MNRQKIDTLIFDLGGVIINLDIQKTVDQLAAYARLDPNKMVELYWGDPLFHNFEKGLISDQTFRDGLRRLLKVDISDKDIDAAWNAMILDIPLERLKMLQALKEDYKLYLLSNTNNIHLQRVNQVFKPINSELLDDYFEKAYYSHHMGMRKPDKEIYQKILDENDLNALKTLFLDDNKDNLQGAETVGLQTFWVQNPRQLKELFNAEKI